VSTRCTERKARGAAAAATRRSQLASMEAVKRRALAKTELGGGQRKDTEEGKAKCFTAAHAGGPSCTAVADPTTPDGSVSAQRGASRRGTPAEGVGAMPRPRRGVSSARAAGAVTGGQLPMPSGREERRGVSEERRRRPGSNEPRQVTAARWRFLLNVKSLGMGSGPCAGALGRA
jgi:hypothetical protein